MKRVYLAGAMEFCPEGGIPWRQDMTEWLRTELGHEVLDPTVLEHDQLTDEQRERISWLKLNDMDELRPLANKIVRYDADLVLNQCDYLVVHWNEATQLGCGTAGEITLAAWAGKPVHMLLEYPANKASTWMIGCTSTIHLRWEDLKATLKFLYGGKS